MQLSRRTFLKAMLTLAAGAAAPDIDLDFLRPYVPEDSALADPDWWDMPAGAWVRLDGVVCPVVRLEVTAKRDVFDLFDFGGTRNLRMTAIEHEAEVATYSTEMAKIVERYVLGDLVGSLANLEWGCGSFNGVFSGSGYFTSWSYEDVNPVVSYQDKPYRPPIFQYNFSFAGPLALTRV